MKKLFLLSFILNLCMICYAQDITTTTNLEKYKDAPVPDPLKVVFIGNSITQGWVDNRPEFFTSNNYAGRGISGQTSPQLLLRFQQDVIALAPQAVVINIGTNDIAMNTGEYSPQFTFDCIKSMTELADYHGIKVILSSILPVYQYGWRPEVKDVPEKIDALNAQIKAFADTKGFAYIDYNTPMKDERGGLKSQYTEDGVHPTKDGFECMEIIAQKVIDKVINNKSSRKK